MLISKIWGYKETVYRDEKRQIDILYLKKDTFCSWHYHHNKINQLILLNGRVNISLETNLKKINYELCLYNGAFIFPLSLHQFVVLEDSIMVEISYVKEGKLDYEGDIIRLKQGGGIIAGVEYTEDELKKRKGWDK